jgi:preprotein translocase subunit SecY
MHGMGEKRKRRKVYRRRSAFKNELRYLFLITIVCFVLAFCLVFITGKLPSFLDKTIQKQADRIAGEKMKDVESEILEKVKKENMEDFVRKYKDKAQGLR